jgi:hypothetical protein
MLALGYEPKGENGTTGSRYFPKGKDNRTHHLHIFQVGSILKILDKESHSVWRIESKLSKAVSIGILTTKHI